MVNVKMFPLERKHCEIYRFFFKKLGRGVSKLARLKKMSHTVFKVAKILFETPEDSLTVYRSETYFRFPAEFQQALLAYHKNGARRFYLKHQKIP
jgi:hypothetical protein